MYKYINLYNTFEYLRTYVDIHGVSMARQIFPKGFSLTSSNRHDPSSIIFNSLRKEFPDYIYSTSILSSLSRHYYNFKVCLFF
jgi:hypothetical protein